MNILPSTQIKYDQQRFEATQDVKKMESTEMDRKREAEDTFNKLFLGMGVSDRPESSDEPEFEVIIPDEVEEN